jgi:hypothetical protein
MAAAIAAAIALIRGSIGMAAVVEGAAVIGDPASLQCTKTNLRDVELSHA